MSTDAVGSLEQGPPRSEPLGAPLAIGAAPADDRADGGALAGPLGRRVPVPTRRLLAGATAALLLAALAPLAPALEPAAWLALSTLGLLVAVDLLARPPRDALAVARLVHPSDPVGRRTSVRVVVTARGGPARPLVVELRQELAPGLDGAAGEAALALAPGAQAPGASGALEVPCVPLERGRHRLPALGVRVRQGLGLIAWQGTWDAEQAVRAVPGRPQGETEWLMQRAAALAEQGRRRLRRRGAEQEFESLREYVVGDELKRIDWKASARRHLPMVRQFESERQAELIVAVDCGRLMGSLVDGVPKLDLALTSVLDLCAVALRRGERVGFLAVDAQPRAWLPPRAGLGQLQRILEAAADLPPCREPVSWVRAVKHLDARHRKRCLVVCMTDFTDELSADDLLASMAALASRHAAIFVAVGDPHLERVFADRALDERALFQRAVAGHLLGERKRVLARLSRAGLVTLDAEPRALSGPLLRAYLEHRLR